MMLLRPVRPLHHSVKNLPKTPFIMEYKSKSLQWPAKDLHFSSHYLSDLVFWFVSPTHLHAALAPLASLAHSACMVIAPFLEVHFLIFTVFKVYSNITVLVETLLTTLFKTAS